MSEEDRKSANSNPFPIGAFALIELVVILGVLAILLLPVLASTPNGRAKRVICMNNLRQAARAAHIYALENQDKLFQGTNEYGFDFTLCIATTMYITMSNQFGDKVFDCPNVYPFCLPGITDNPKGRYQTGTGYYIGYNYHGGRITKRGAGWKSPLKISDQPERNDPTIVPVDQLVLFSDPNCWIPGSPGSYRWVMAPHTRSGSAAKRNGIAWIYPSEGQTSKEMGAIGGNVGLLDGSVAWKKIDAMNQNYWTYSGDVGRDVGHRAAW